MVGSKTFKVWRPLRTLARGRFPLSAQRSADLQTRKGRNRPSLALVYSCAGHRSNLRQGNWKWLARGRWYLSSAGGPTK